MAATYPASVKSFSAIVDGTDYPQATQINQVYDEVAAMEAALLTTGLAHTLKFVDATYDIGATASTFRPRDLFLSRNALVMGLLQFASATGPRMRAQEVTALANDGTQVLFTGINPQGVIFACASDGSVAVYVSDGTTTYEIADPATSWTPTADTGSSYNLYVTGGELTLQNKSGAQRDAKVVVLQLT